MALLNAYGAPYRAATPAAAPTVTAAPGGGRVLSYGPVVTPAPAPAPAGRAPTYPGSAVITVNVANPKSGKSYARFNLYGPGPGARTTVAAYLAAGGYRADIAWDVARGFISVTAPAA